MSWPVARATLRRVHRMQLPNVSITWQSENDPAAAVGTNTVVTIIHGQTLYNYLNLPREEVECRFQKVMTERNPILAAREPTTASALTTHFDDEFMLWLNAGDELKTMAEDLFGMLAELNETPPKNE